MVAIFGVDYVLEHEMSPLILEIFCIANIGKAFTNAQENKPTMGVIMRLVKALF